MDAMQLRHEKKMYPPRVKMMVGMKNPDDHDIYKLSVKIEGCSEEDQLDIQFFFPPSMYCIVSWWLVDRFCARNMLSVHISHFIQDHRTEVL